MDNTCPDPYHLRISTKRIEVDLEAEKVIEIEKGSQKILVEIKSFTSTTILPDFYSAHGQYEFYRDAMNDNEMEHELYLAISTVTYFRLSQDPIFLKRLAQHEVKLLVVDLNTETIKQWIN